MNEPDLTLYHMLRNTIDKYGGLTAARFRDGDVWKELTYEDWARQIREFALGLAELGAGPQQKIVHVADNRLEWMIVSMGITTIGYVDVPRGTDATYEDLEYIINHTEAELLVAENQKVLDKLAPNWGKLGRLKTIILVEGTPPQIPDKSVRTLAGVMESGRKALTKRGAEPYDALGRAVRPDDLATIIYTSGTTGTPKGVMLLHRNLAWMCLRTAASLNVSSDHSTMFFLPPWHIAERLLETAIISVGGSGSFTTIPNMVKDLVVCRPTVMLAVPRLWEAMYAKIHDNVARASFLARGLFRFAEAGAIRYTLAKQSVSGLVAHTHEPSLGESLKRFAYVLSLPLLFLWGGFGWLVLGKIKKILGGRVKLAFSGAGTLPAHIDLFFRACGVPIVEAYGMTETTGVTTMRRWDRNKLRTLGPPLTGTEIQLRTETAEVIGAPGIKGIAWHRGPHIMKGYYREAEKTDQVIDAEGWLNSGDLLMRTLTGEYVFAGRAKDTIVLLGGENLEPGPIEDKLKESPFINQVMVVGQDRKALGVLITPNVDSVTQWAHKNSITLPADRWEWNAETHLRELFKAEIRTLISSQNGFKSFERITGFAILPAEFEAGRELTQTMKVRRNIVEELYTKEIAGLFGDS